MKAEPGTPDEGVVSDKKRPLLRGSRKRPAARLRRAERKARSKEVSAEGTTELRGFPGHRV